MWYEFEANFIDILDTQKIGNHKIARAEFKFVSGIK